MTVLFCWLAVANLVTGALTVYDKYAAKTNRRRIPENTLLLWAVLGGSPAEYIVMRCIRHKTLHRKFMAGLPVLFLLQLALSAIAVYYLYFK